MERLRSYKFLFGGLREGFRYVRDMGLQGDAAFSLFRPDFAPGTYNMLSPSFVAQPSPRHCSKAKSTGSFKALEIRLITALARMAQRT